MQNEELDEIPSRIRSVTSDVLDWVSGLKLAFQTLAVFTHVNMSTKTASVTAVMSVRK